MGIGMIVFMTVIENDSFKSKHTYYIHTKC